MGEDLRRLKRVIFSLIRWLVTGLLLIGVYNETGIYTFSVLTLIILAMEVITYSLRVLASKELENMNRLVSKLDIG